MSWQPTLDGDRTEGRGIVGKLRPSTRGWFRVHSFTGVITGLMLFVICWSGTFAVLGHELDWLVTPEARVQSGDVLVSWDEMAAAIEKAYPAAEVTWFEAPRYPRSAAQAIVRFPDQDFVWVYVDPYTSEVQGAYSYFNVQRFFRSLHYSLFIPDFGLYVVSVFALSMLTSLAAALSFYKRWWRRFLRWPYRHGRAFWSEVHRTGGLWSIWFLIVIGITGVWYLFEAARMDFGDGKVNWAGDPQYAVHALRQSTSDPALPPLPLDALSKRAKTMRPDLEIRSISLEPDRAVFRGQADHFLVRDRANQIHLDRRTGEELHDQTPRDYSLYWRWSDTADPLHFGDFGGLWSKLIWFVFGLLLSVLILTGTYLHVQRLARDAGGRHRWPGTGAAVLVSLAVLCATVPLGFREAREFYGPTVEGVKQLPDLAPGVEAVIVGWVALTLGIIAAWVFLLWRPSHAQAARMGNRRAQDTMYSS